MPVLQDKRANLVPTSPAGEVFVNGQCISRPSGLTACAPPAGSSGPPACVNTQTDVNNCGACGNVVKSCQCPTNPPPPISDGVGFFSVGKCINGQPVWDQYIVIPGQAAKIYGTNLAINPCP
jgi:hypothetical protein